MDSNNKSSMSSDLSSQQIVVNQLMNKLMKNVSVINCSDKSKEVESHESKTSVTSDESNTTQTTTEMIEMDRNGESETAVVVLLKKQLIECWDIIERLISDKQSMKREIKELKDKVIKYENKSNDKDLAVMGRQERSGQHNIEDMFAQIVNINNKVCDRG